MNADAAKIAHAFKRAIYGECEKDELFWGLPVRQFTALIASNRLDWTACCDEAFDDSSYLLQFEDQSHQSPALARSYVARVPGLSGFPACSQLLRELQVSLMMIFMSVKVAKTDWIESRMVRHAQSVWHYLEGNNDLANRNPNHCFGNTCPSV